jgi:hypothetical protein
LRRPNKETRINQSSRPEKRYPTIGACGLDCGLCPKYYTVGKSRCPGCCGPDFFNKHPSCPYITCCVKKRNLEVCGECPEFPCAKFKTPAEYEAAETSSYPPCTRVLPNLNFIKEHAIRSFIRQQQRRIKLLERMIANFDDGRSRSFFCRAAALLEPASVKSLLDEAAGRIESAGIGHNDVKTKAEILRSLLDEAAAREGVELRLKAPPKRKGSSP